MPLRPSTYQIACNLMLYLLLDKIKFALKVKVLLDSGGVFEKLNISHTYVKIKGHVYKSLISPVVSGSENCTMTQCNVQVDKMKII